MTFIPLFILPLILCDIPLLHDFSVSLYPCRLLLLSTFQMPPAHAWSVSSAVRAPTAVSPFPGCVTGSKTVPTTRTKGRHVMEYKYSYTYK